MLMHIKICGADNQKVLMRQALVRSVCKLPVRLIAIIISAFAIFSVTPDEVKAAAGRRGQNLLHTPAAYLELVWYLLLFALIAKDASQRGYHERLAGTFVIFEAPSQAVDGDTFQVTLWATGCLVAGLVLTAGFGIYNEGNLWPIAAVFGAFAGLIIGLCSGIIFKIAKVPRRYQKHLFLGACVVTFLAFRAYMPSYRVREHLSEVKPQTKLKGPRPITPKHRSAK